jgi:radical SAM protein with 4Fe4S-binding SPASM domain
LFTYFISAVAFNILSQNKASQYLIPLGSCRPGTKRPMVMCNGDIVYCDTAAEVRPNIIGNVKKAHYDFENIQLIIKEFRYAGIEECRACYAWRTCPFCYTLMEKIRDVQSSKNILPQCTALRRRVKDGFEILFDADQSSRGLIKKLLANKEEYQKYMTIL